jgi:hypothetical protein
MEQSKSDKEIVAKTDHEEYTLNPEQPEYNHVVNALKEKAEMQQAVEAAAEERAMTPFQVAAQNHMMMCPKFLAAVDNISGGAAKRILKYLVAYPFFIKDLNPQDKEVEQVAYIAEKLVECKHTIILCQALEREARVHAAIQEQEALIQPLPDDLPKAQENTNNESGEDNA